MNSLAIVALCVVAVGASDLSHHAITGHVATLPIVKHISLGHSGLPLHGSSLHGYAHGHSHYGSIGPSGVVTGTKVVGPSGVVTGHGASGPSGYVNGHGAVGPSGEHNGHGLVSHGIKLGHAHDLTHHSLGHTGGIVKFGQPHDFLHHSVAHHAAASPILVHGSHLHHDLHHDFGHHAPVHHHVGVIKPIKYTSYLGHHH